MGLKDWFKSKPYWLQGGIIGTILAIVFSLAYIICILRHYKDFSGFGGIECMIFLMPSIPLMDFFDSLFSSYGNTFLILSLHITNFTILFLFGTLIGWLVEKVKYKKHIE